MIFFLKALASLVFLLFVLKALASLVFLLFVLKALASLVFLLFVLKDDVKALPTKNMDSMTFDQHLNEFRSNCQKAYFNKGPECLRRLHGDQAEEHLRQAIKKGSSDGHENDPKRIKKISELEGILRSWTKNDKLTKQSK